jgi:hypothetical protein
MTFKRSSTVALALVLAGCGGGGAGGVSPAATHAANTGPTSSSLVVQIPSKDAAGKMRHPRYVSANSKSIGIQLNPNPNCGPSCTPPTTLNAGLTPASPNCAATPNGTSCTLPLGLAPGSYTAGITIYDGPLDAAGAPTGFILSHGQSVPVQVVQGTNNVVNTTLAGVPGGIKFAFAGGQGRYDANYQRLIVTMGGNASLRGDPVDADGNVMVGPGAPSVTFPALSQTYSSKQDPTTGIVTVTAPATGVKTTGILTATVNSPDCASSPPTACNGWVAAGPEVYVAIADTGANRAVVVNPTGPSNAPVATVTGITSPNLVAFDPKGDLFVAQGTPPYSVRVYAPPYTGAPIATVTNGINDPRSIVVAANGDLFVGNDGTNAVTRYTAPYTGAPASTTTNGIHGPHGLVVDSIGMLFVANSANSTLNSYAAPYLAVTKTTSQGVSAPSALSIANSGIIVVANSGGNSVTLYDPSTLGAPLYTIPVGGSPAGVASLGGTIGVADSTGNDFRILTFPYGSQMLNYSTNVNAPVSVAVDAYAAFYVADSGAGFAQQMAPPYNPFAISYYINLTNPRGVAAWP